MRKIIAFTGKKGVGKNFVADIARNVIETAYKGYKGGGSVSCFAFADPMKEFLINILGVDRDMIYGDDKAKNTPTQYRWESMPGWLQEKFGKNEGPITIRHSMQIFGTELNREIWDREVWVKAMRRRIESSGAGWVFVTDARYQNEIDMIQGMGGKVWRVDGPQRGDEFAKKDAHSSEISMDSTVNYDYTLLNEMADTPATLEAKVRQALRDCFHDRIIDTPRTEVNLEDVLKDMKPSGDKSYGGPEDMGYEFGGSDF